MIDDILETRQKTYGSFEDNAHLAQQLKQIMRGSRNWFQLTNTQREGLEMIQSKIARMLNGDPSYIDNVIDIVGYSTLIKKEMERSRVSEMGE